MTNIRTNEKGLVSIVVTVVMMLVISITVLSFAQIIRREQRQALDNQLSSQAFYAAESGINQARKYIFDTWISRGETPPDKDLCGEDLPYYTNDALPRVIDNASNTSSSCLLVIGSPKSLRYDLSPSAGSKVFPIESQAGAIRSLEVTWTPSTRSAPRTGCSTSGNVPAELPAASAWPCRGYGLIRIDLVAANDMTRDAMMRNMFTAFLSPASPGTNTPVSYNGVSTNVHGGLANQGTRVAGSCTDAECKVTINNMTGTKYYARISTLYRETSLGVVARDAGGTDLRLIGAQVVLDSTGRAQDVLRRIQVRVPLIGDGFHPDYGVQTTDNMCKLLTTFPGYPTGGC